MPIKVEGQINLHLADGCILGALGRGTLNTALSLSLSLDFQNIQYEDDWKTVRHRPVIFQRFLTAKPFQFQHRRRILSFPTIMSAHTHTHTHIHARTKIGKVPPVWDQTSEDTRLVLSCSAAVAGTPWCTWLRYCAKAGRSRVRFQMKSLEFFSDIILPAALRPVGRFRLQQK